MRFAAIASGFWVRRSVTVPTTALVSYLLLMLISTHLPPSGFRDLRLFELRFRFSDKLSHAAAYGGLTLLALAVWRIHRPVGIDFTRKVFAVLSICLLIASWGLMDEATQPFFGRQFDWLDWVANLLGISLGVCASASIPRTTRTWWLAAFSMR